MFFISGFTGQVSIGICMIRIVLALLDVKHFFIFSKVCFQFVQFFQKQLGYFRIMFLNINQISMQTSSTLFHKSAFFLIRKICILIWLYLISCNRSLQLLKPVQMPGHTVREHKIRGEFMIDHRRQPQDFACLIAYKCNVLIMVILITFQNRDQYLNRQLLRQFLMGLEIICVQYLCIVIEHLTIIYIIINVYFVTRILPKELQEIHQVFTFSVDHRTYSSIIIILLSLRLIVFANGKLILRSRNKILINHPRPEYFCISKQRSRKWLRLCKWFEHQIFIKNRKIFFTFDHPDSFCCQVSCSG